MNGLSIAQLTGTLVLIVSTVSTFLSFLSMNLEAYYSVKASLLRSPWFLSLIILLFILLLNASAQYVAIIAFVTVLAALNLLVFWIRGLTRTKQTVWRVASLIEGLKYPFSLNLAFLVISFSKAFLSMDLPGQNIFFQLAFFVNGGLNGIIFLKTSVSTITRENFKPTLLIEDEEGIVVREDGWIMLCAILHLAIAYSVVALLGVENLTTYFHLVKEKLWEFINL